MPKIWDSLASAATVRELDALLAICTNQQYGWARQMVVDSLRRYKKAAPAVTPTLMILIEDPDVALHAMSALRAVIGNADAVPHLERISASHRGTSVGAAADRELRKARKALSRA